MKKSELVAKALILVRDGNFGFACTAITYAAVTVEDGIKAEEIRADISKFLESQCAGITLNSYFTNMGKRLSPHIDFYMGDYEAFVHVGRIRFMEMLIEKYKLRGD